MAYGNKESGIYKLQPTGSQHGSIVDDVFLHTKVEESSKVVNHVDCKDLILLDTRLGHASLSEMSHLDDIPNDVLNKFICDSCQMAKFHRVPFLLAIQGLLLLLS